MLGADIHLWRLSDGGDRSLGVCCTQEGLFLGRTPLVERRGSRYQVRKQADLERLLGRAYGSTDLSVDGVMPGLDVVAAALGEHNLCLAQIAAVHLRLPELPDMISRSALEAEDILIKVGCGGEVLARGGWDPAEHPRAGVPPNPGWFAPTDGEIAQNEEDERALEEPADHLAPVRQKLWDAAIAQLREIDPQNPPSYLSNPETAPSQQALDRLYDMLRQAVLNRVTDKLMPNGSPIGRSGRGARVRELPGGSPSAERLFNYLSKAGIVHRSTDDMRTVKLPGSAGFITIRPSSRSGGPAVDVNVPGIPFKKIHFD